MTLSNWLVGSCRLAQGTTFTVNGSATDPFAGEMYLYDATAPSLITIVIGLIADAVPGSTGYIGRDRKLRIVSGGGALTLVFSSTVATLLGMPTSPTAATTITATYPSTLLWSPSWRGTPSGMPLGVAYREVDDVKQTVSPDGSTIRTTVHATQRVAGWTWSAVPRERVWTTDDGLGGEFRAFDGAVLRLGRRFKIYELVDESDLSSTAVTWPSPDGPYIMSLADRDADWYRRMVNGHDQWANIEIRSAVLTGEIA